MADRAQDSVVQLAEQLLEGFVALSGEYQQLFNQQRQLEGKLSWAKQQYLDVLKRHTPETLSQDHLTFLQDLERVSAEPSRSQFDWAEQLGQSEEERQTRINLIRQAEAAAVKLRNKTEENGVRIWSGPSADKRPTPLRIQSDLSSMEKDFTTSGTPSRLGCPFAARSGKQSPLATPRSSTSRMSFSGVRSKRPSFTDPIRAEICGNDQVSAAGSPSVEGSAAVCPIRFLDQHAPEEVAKYFENHKHEIPRSHEVCIKRFQSNAESIEQLDRKYGNLVSMIQGLGEKHQNYLPQDLEEEDGPVTEARTEQKVEKWAKAVSNSLQNMTPDEESSPENVLDEARTAHFDRPMKEIRVGESPSRPWGISIPAKYTNAESSSSVGSAPTASPALPIDSVPVPEHKPQQPSKCPFDHKALGKPPVFNPEADPSSIPTNMAHAQVPAPNVEASRNPEQAHAHEPPPQSPQQQDSSPDPKVIPQMVFNGPVFLGYPPDQLMKILQNSNLGGAMK